MFQLHLRLLQPCTLRLRQRLAGAVDIEGQHRQRRAICAGLAARTVLGGTLERCGDLLRLVSLKTPRLRSSASLSRVTRCDHRFGEDFFAGFCGCSFGVRPFASAWPSAVRACLAPWLFCRKRPPDHSVPKADLQLRGAAAMQFRDLKLFGTPIARAGLSRWRASCLPQFDVKTLGLGVPGVFLIGPIRWLCTARQEAAMAERGAIAAPAEADQ